MTRRLLSTSGSELWRTPGKMTREALVVSVMPSSIPKPPKRISSSECSLGSTTAAWKILGGGLGWNASDAMLICDDIPDLLDVICGEGARR